MTPSPGEIRSITDLEEAITWRWDRGDMDVPWGKQRRAREEAAKHFGTVIDFMSAHERLELWRKLKA